MARNFALSGRTKRASVLRPSHAARVAPSMSARNRCSAFSHTEARTTNMPLFQK
jgi:hypothetical protein